jgi:glucosamine-6-phosphate deaminase
MTEVVILDTVEEVRDLAATAVLALISRKPRAVLGVATGSTPLPVYQALAARCTDMDLSQVTAFALDEYVGLPPEHPQSYRSVVTREVVDQLGLSCDRVHVPEGAEATIEHAGAAYERAIDAAGGIDLQILGIGTDGHLGFNEPGSSFASLTRVKTLTAQTRADNATFFGSPNAVPRHCITQGIGTILRARHLVLLAFGDKKADAIAAAVEGPVTSMTPASAIQLHPHATVIVDARAATKLKHADYYRYVFVNKPTWQEL